MGKAKILMDEARLGYAHHVWLAMANMSEAEDEILTYMPDEATKIREERVKIEKSLRDETDLYVPDFIELMYNVGKGALLEETQDGKFIL